MDRNGRVASELRALATQHGVYAPLLQLDEDKKEIAALKQAATQAREEADKAQKELKELQARMHKNVRRWRMSTTS